MIRPMPAMARLAAAILPLVGLAALWGMSAKTYSEGTEWEVPIQGYDPRDYLRGHYVEFGYDWPGLANDSFANPEHLCIEGSAPHIDKVTIPAGTTSVLGRITQPAATPASCAHPLTVNGGDIYGMSALSRGRLYIGQARAEQLQQQLQNRDQRGIVTIRQREDGSFTPISIRFRPLTPAERAERDAPRRQIGAPFDPSAPPPVMIQQ